VIEFSASITRACTLQMIRAKYVRTYVSSTMSRHSSAETKTVYIPSFIVWVLWIKIPVWELYT